MKVQLLRTTVAMRIMEKVQPLHVPGDARVAICRMSIFPLLILAGVRKSLIRDPILDFHLIHAVKHVRALAKDALILAMPHVTLAHVHPVERWVQPKTVSVA